MDPSFKRLRVVTEIGMHIEHWLTGKECHNQRERVTHQSHRDLPWKPRGGKKKLS